MSAPNASSAPEGGSAGNGGPRLAIHRLVLDNFKSYAGRVEIGPFHTNFSAVVGPNGSGKSNVMDGILFVFGKQAKKLRLNKVSELIHNSEQFPDLQSATVTITFHDLQDDGAWVPVPNSEFTIARRAKRNDTSDYTLDGRATTREAVVSLLKNKGVDLDNNRFLILQGEVEQIAMMPPKGRAGTDETGLLEYLEDIIGSDKHVPVIEQAAKEYEQYNEQRVEKLHRVKFVQGELASLAPARDEAQRYLRLEAQAVDKQALIYHAQHHTATRKATALEAEEGKLAAALEQQRAAVAAFMAEHGPLEGKQQEAQAAVQQAEEALEKSKAAYAGLEKEDAQVRELLKHSKGRVKKLEKDEQQASTTAAAKEQAQQEAKVQAEQAEEELKRLGEALLREEAALDKVVEEARTTLAPLLLKVEEENHALLPLQQAVNVAQADRDLAQHELQAHGQRQADALSRLQQAEKELQGLAEQLAQRRARLSEAQGERQVHEGKAKQLAAEREGLSVSEKELSSSLSQVRGRVAEAQMAQQQRSGASAAQKVALALLELQKKGVLRGVRGRLGDLGTVKDLATLDTAMSTAAGGRFDSVVVETTEAAQRAVEELRTRNLGRATFIILDKVARELGDKMRHQPELPQGAQRLYDLVHAQEEALKPAFYHVLRDTLVAPTLSEATAMALDKKQRWRVVTLKGELVDTAGTMSGGGQPLQDALARAPAPVPQGKEEDLQQHKDEKEAQLREVQLAELRQRDDHLDKAQRDLQRGLLALQREIARLELELGQLEKQHSEQQARLPSLRQAAQSERSAGDEKELRQLADLLKTKEAALTVALGRTQAGTLRLAALQRQVDQAGGEKRTQAKAKVEAVQRLVAEAQRKAAEHGGQRTAHERSAAKARKDAAKAATELTNERTRRGELEARLGALVEEAQRIVTEQESLVQAHEEAQQAARVAEEQWTAARTALTQLREAEQGLTHQAEDAAKRRKELRQRIAELERKLEALGRQKKGLGLERLRAPQAPPQAPPPSEDAMDLEVPPQPREEQEDAALSSSLPQPSAEELEGVQVEVLVAEVAGLREELGKMRPNLAALEEWAAKARAFDLVVQEHDALAVLCEEQRLRHEELKRVRHEQFMRGFQTINLQLAAMYKMITLEDGDADLQLLDSVDPFTEGLAFRVRPPKKSWKIIAQLSGGEKTLASLALVFALQVFKPNSLYLMDEIDAALDFRNVSVIGNYLRKKALDVQFIIISLRSQMFELADLLVGIYKTNNQTKSVPIEVAHFELPQLAAKPADS